MSAAPAVLALDAGNSATKAAVWTPAGWGPVARWPADTSDADVWAARLWPLAPPGGVAVVGLASVVPARTEALAGGARRAFGVAAARVSADSLLPFAMGYRTPATLGADRIAAAVAAWAIGGGRPVVVVDAGTALTVDAVGLAAGVPTFLGGAIAPGPDLLAVALARGTGQLPRADLADAPDVGATTAEAIAAGVAGLFAGGALALVERTRRALGPGAAVVATGGWADWLVARGLPADVVEPRLVLEGVRLCAMPGYPTVA